MSRTLIRRLTYAASSIIEYLAGERKIDFVYFDIGGTLGDRNAAGTALIAFPSSVGLLKAMRDEVGLRIGVITTLGPTLSTDDGLRLLRGAGMKAIFKPCPPGRDLPTSYCKSQVTCN